MRRAARALAALALAALGARAETAPPYGPPPPPAPPEGYQRELTEQPSPGGPRFLMWKPSAPSGILLIVDEEEPSLARIGDPDLLQTARERKMTILFAGASSARAPLRETIAHLRRSAVAKKVIGSARGETDSFRNESAWFDALLLAGGAPPPEQKGPPFIVRLYGSDAFWSPAAGQKETDSKAPNRRSFFVAGAVLSSDGSANCLAPANNRSIEPARRALLTALDDYLRRGAAVPPTRPAVLAPAKGLRWPKIPNMPSPPGDVALAPAIDADGNETSGLRLPDQALPIATFTGWNAPRDAAKGKCPAGAAFPFPESETARKATGDPRLSLPERYGSRAYFVGALRSVADKLVKERLLLPQDADAYVAAGKSAPF